MPLVLPDRGGPMQRFHGHFIRVKSKARCARIEGASKITQG